MHINSETPIPISELQTEHDERCINYSLLRWYYFYGQCGAELNGYRTLTDDWDGYGGVAPAASAIADAEISLTAIRALALPPPRAMVSGTGSVGLYWRGPEYYCEIEFAGDGTISYYGQGRDHPAFGKEGALMEAELPEEVVYFVRTINWA